MGPTSTFAGTVKIAGVAARVALPAEMKFAMTPFYRFTTSAASGLDGIIPPISR